MRPTQYPVQRLAAVFRVKKVLTMKEVMDVLGTRVRMTAFRKLSSLGYQSSYSHSGKYYTLQPLADYDQDGLWSFHQIRFSQFGSLSETLQSLVGNSEMGYFASELKERLKVQVQDALLKLYRSEQLVRKQVIGEYLYLAPGVWELQWECRQQFIEAMERDPEQKLGLESEELRESFRLFLSTLNEKQRRLYAAFESMKLGRGGDAMVARLTGLNFKTIAKGRQELLSRNITPGRIRREGAGRPSVKKNERDPGA